MDKGRFLIETHRRTGTSIKDLAAAHGVSESWLFKLWARYRREGDAGLEPRSRRPHTSPTRIADLYEDEIVAWRKRLDEDGLDGGAESIHFYMSTPGRNVPSISTIHRVLVARGFVVPEPASARRAAGSASRRTSPTSAGRATSLISRRRAAWSTSSSTWSTTTRGSACLAGPS
jgi:hypothetical protein